MFKFSFGVVRPGMTKDPAVEQLQDHQKQGQYGFYSRVYKALGFPSQPSENDENNGHLDRYI